MRLSNQTENINLSYLYLPSTTLLNTRQNGQGVRQALLNSDIGGEHACLHSVYHDRSLPDMDDFYTATMMRVLIEMVPNSSARCARDLSMLMLRLSAERLARCSRSSRHTRQCTGCDIC